MKTCDLCGQPVGHVGLPLQRQVLRLARLVETLQRASGATDDSEQAVLLDARAARGARHVAVLHDALHARAAQPPNQEAIKAWEQEAASALDEVPRREP